jgi:hypothetical protein
MERKEEVEESLPHALLRTYFRLMDCCFIQKPMHHANRIIMRFGSASPWLDWEYDWGA